MKKFLLIFRADNNIQPMRTPDDVQAMTKRWMDWFQDISAKEGLVDRGNRLQNEGRVIKSDLTTDGPFVEIKEMVGGYSLIKAPSLDDAEAMAKGCPILSVGGSVEVREISVL